MPPEQQDYEQPPQRANPRRAQPPDDTPIRRPNTSNSQPIRDDWDDEDEWY